MIAVMAEVLVVVVRLAVAAAVVAAAVAAAAEAAAAAAVILGIRVLGVSTPIPRRLIQPSIPVSVAASSVTLERIALCISPLEMLLLGMLVIDFEALFSGLSYCGVLDYPFCWRASFQFV